MRRDAHKADHNVTVIAEGGIVLVNGTPLDLGPLRIARELSRGANGVVFEAIDPVLERKVAVKFWLALRRGDMRDKSEQGLAESRKLWVAQRTEVARAFYAGYAGDIFFTVMELVPGKTLHEWLRTEAPSLGARCFVAERIVSVDSELQQHGIVHGDLHWKNIFVLEDPAPRDYFDISTHRRWQVKLLDFGTSFYSGRAPSRRRHYTVLEETLNHCVSPLILDDLKAALRPADLDVRGMRDWLYRALYSIRAAAFELGYEYVGWPLHRSFGSLILTTQGFGLDTTEAKKAIQNLVAGGTHATARDLLGDSPEWGPFDGRTAERRD